MNPVGVTIKPHSRYLGCGFCIRAYHQHTTDFSDEHCIGLQNASSFASSSPPRFLIFSKFKVSYLTGRIIETIYKIWGDSDPTIKDDMLEAMKISLEGKTNSTNNNDVDDSANFKHLTVKELENTNYTLLYSGEQLKKFCEIFNDDVRVERMKNARNAWKVRMIAY